MYDFANSAFATVILAVIFNRYYAGVVANGADGVLVSFFGSSKLVHGAAMFNFVVTISMFLVAISAPILGAWADSRAAKKLFLAIHLLIGVISTGMLSTVDAGEWIWGGVWFILANYGFAGGNVFYNSFLKDLATSEEMGRISGWGWGIGYLGGGFLLLLNLLMLNSPEVLGFPEGTFTVKHCFFSVSIWWALFSLPILLNVHEKRTTQAKPFLGGAREAFTRIHHSFKQIRRYKELLKFLIAYLFFNDGIETIIIMAAVFGDQTLGMAQDQLIYFFLLIQFTAFAGSLLFGKISTGIGNKNALIVTLIIWCSVVIFAFFIGWTGYPIHEFFFMGIVAGMVMGASQSLARSLQGTFTPDGKEAEFFGFFAISGRFASLFGPLTFGAVIAITGSIRWAILALIAFFLIGIALLITVDEKEGQRCASTV